MQFIKVIYIKRLWFFCYKKPYEKEDEEKMIF